MELLRAMTGIRLGAGAMALLMLSAIPGGTITSARAAAPPACPVATGLKPLIRGLVDRAQIPPAAGLQASGIYVKWSDLEPSGPGLFSGNPIDVALAAAGCATPLRLRVQAGVAAPEWVKKDSGGAVSVTDPFGGTTGTTIGRFWTSKFRDDYDNLQSELATLYDSVPNLAEVVVSRCSMFYPEPFLRGTSIQSNVSNLLAAGYTEAADQQCQLEEIDSSVSHWTTARVGVSFNPYQVVDPNKPVGVDEGFTEQVMGYCRYTAKQRCVLENDSIRDPISGLGSQYAQMYAAMSGAAGPIHVTVGRLNVNVALGAPLAFQTAVTARIGDFWGTLVWARQHHAASVELPVNGYPTSGGAGAPPWQTIAEVAQWFQEDPALTAIPLAAVEGKATTGMGLANLTLDELAALDTIAGYGDVGSVPFDSVSAEIGWPDGVTEPALLTTGQGLASSVSCPHQRWCGVVIESGGHTLAEEASSAPASVNVILAWAGVAYIPADGISPAAMAPVSVADAALSLVKLGLGPTHTPKKVLLSAVFGDADPGGLSSDYKMTITWGDGTMNVVPITKVTGGFSGGMTHAYSKAGTYSVGVAVADVGRAALTTRRSITVH
jgi:hypothetical protein